MADLEQPVVLITGAAGNLGRAVAEAFSDRSKGLALLDISAAGLEATAASLPEKAQTLTIETNLIDPTSVAAAVRSTLDKFGSIDVVANIAGGFRMGPPVHETTDDDWEFMMDLNARSVFNVSRATVPHLLENGGGRIVNVSARAATEGKGKMAPYCASKAAVITLTQSLAAEHKHANINVNCILPGTVDTPENRSAMPDANHAHWVPPAALADVVVFLASDAARCVTGAAVPVYGQS